MENKNVSFDYTLKQYSKKYRNRGYRLLKFAKKDVEEFDRKYGHYIFNGKTYDLEFKNYLLKNRKWCYIKATDTYYEIPKPIRFTWFRNLNAWLQAASCILGVGVIATSVAVPTYLMTKKAEKDPEPVSPVEEITYIINPAEPFDIGFYTVPTRQRFGPTEEADWKIPSNLKVGNTLEMYFVDVSEGATINVTNGWWSYNYLEGQSITADNPLKFEFTDLMKTHWIDEGKDGAFYLTNGSAKLSKMLFRTIK